MTGAIRIATVFICGLLISSVSFGQAQLFTLGPYGYDGAGNVTAIGTDSFTYDEFGRITWGTAGAGRNERYTYDRWGNLVTITTDDATSPRVTIGVNPATNRASESTGGANAFASYNANTGQITSWTNGSFTHDAAGMVKESTIDGVTRVHLYSPSDERIASIAINQNVETISEWSFRDTAGRVLRRASRAAGNDNNWTWHQDYIYRDGQLLAAEVPTSAGRLHFHLDHLGTPRLITDRGGREVSRHTYYPFGMEATPRSTAERMKFTGHERDFAAGAGTDLDYMHARLFRPAWGRFLSVDPAMDLEKIMQEPQLWNRYSYVGNNPLKFTDPDGRERLAYWHFNRQPVPDRGFKTEMIETSKTAAIFGAALVGPALAAEGAFEVGLLMMRNPGTVLAAMKLLDAMGGNTSSHINTTGLTGGKHGYLLDNATKTGFFRGVMGFTEKTIGAALRSHFAENVAKNSKVNENGLLEVTGRMVDAKGRAWSVTTVWQWVEKTKTWALVTADNYRQVK